MQAMDKISKDTLDLGKMFLDDANRLKAELAAERTPEHQALLDEFARLAEEDNKPRASTIPQGYSLVNEPFIWPGPTALIATPEDPTLQELQTKALHKAGERRAKDRARKAATKKL